MCFPGLFPTGTLGEYHPRQFKLGFSKSRLLSNDDRFRKNAQYVFYQQWQKEMREVSAGMYNLLKSTRMEKLSVSSLLQARSSDEQLEANLSTMLQSVLGTKQYWFKRQSELKTMIREFSPPTFFLTFSCAEYEADDIANYLRKLNKVPPSYSISKLCTEDPISVSRKFSSKFHAFFRKVILNGRVLGDVTHYNWKKEYQARGAPHYQVIVWIDEAPVIDRDDPEDVLSWIQERITCRIPNKESNPKLHRLVTRYQMHKCRAYCKRKRKVGSVYLASCRFGFPRKVSASAKLNQVSECLKSKKRIYQLPRLESMTTTPSYSYSGRLT